MEKGQVILVARDCSGERVTIDSRKVVSAVKEMMDSVHSRLLEKYTSIKLPFLHGMIKFNKYRARKELDTRLMIVESWDLFCVELDKKKVL